MQMQARKTLNALTGARFLAAYWVLIYHFTIQFRYVRFPGKPAVSTSLPSLLAPTLLQGHLGVDFFFLLSGFILAYTYLSSDGGLRGTKRAFWVARIARIYPVYLLGLILGLYPFYLEEHHVARRLVIPGILHLLMLHAWIPIGLDWNQPSWSLGVESTFYLLFPFVLPLVARLPRRSLWLLVFVSWLLFAAINLDLLAFTQAGFGHLFFFWTDLVRYEPLVSMPEFIAGTALGLLFTRDGGLAIPWLPRLRGWTFDILILVMLALLSGVMAIIYAMKLNSSPVDIGAPFALPMLAGVIVLLAYQRGIFAWLLSTPIMVWLGEISYGIYILQKPVWALFDKHLWSVVDGISMFLIHRPANDYMLLAGLSLLLIACASFSFKFLETPLRRWIRATWSKPAPKVVTQVAVQSSREPVPWSVRNNNIRHEDETYQA